MSSGIGVVKLTFTVNDGAPNYGQHLDASFDEVFNELASQ